MCDTNKQQKGGLMGQTRRNRSSEWTNHTSIKIDSGIGMLTGEDSVGQMGENLKFWRAPSTVTGKDNKVDQVVGKREGVGQERT